MEKDEAMKGKTRRGKTKQEKSGQGKIVKLTQDKFRQRLRLRLKIQTDADIVTGQNKINQSLDQDQDLRWEKTHRPQNSDRQDTLTGT
jgi:hypothetical protein